MPFLISTRAGFQLNPGVASAAEIAQLRAAGAVGGTAARRLANGRA
jgi:hypothetical protein